MSMLGGITIGKAARRSSRPYFLGRLRGFSGLGFTTFSRLRRNSCFVGVGVSSPCGVFCFSFSSSLAFY